MAVLIVRERLPYHPLLGRNVNHDSRSRAFPVRTQDVTVKSVRWQANMPILDQGNLGSCTGNAGVGCLGRGDFYDSLHGGGPYALNEDGAVALYSKATALDDYSGTYPPDDTGSDGLSVGKALKAAGDISGYLWSFTPDTARQALMQSPVLTGLPWYNSMFDPDMASGEVVLDTSSGLAGGHELCVDGYVMLGPSPSDDDQVWFSNSWGDSWGVNGRAFWRMSTWRRLLGMQGDVTQFVVASQPEPTPTPDPDDPGTGQPSQADRALELATRSWRSEHHTGANRDAARAVKTWWKTINGG